MRLQVCHAKWPKTTSTKMAAKWSPEIDSELEEKTVFNQAWLVIFSFVEEPASLVVLGQALLGASRVGGV